MASITIRKLDDGVKTRLRLRAAENGRSMEEEARVILREAVASDAGPDNLAVAIRARFRPSRRSGAGTPATRAGAGASQVRLKSLHVRP